MRDHDEFVILDGRLIDVQGRLRFLNLQQKELFKIMSELSDAVQAIKDDVIRIGDGVKKVLDLLQQPTPDVAGAVAALTEADKGLDAAAEAMEAAVQAPAEPPA